MATLQSRTNVPVRTFDAANVFRQPDPQLLSDARVAVGGADDIVSRIATNNPGKHQLSRHGNLATDMPAYKDRIPMYPKAPSVLTVAERDQAMFGRPAYPSGDAPVRVAAYDHASIPTYKVMGKTPIDEYVAEYYEVNDFTHNPLYGAGATLMGPPLGNHMGVPTSEAGHRTFRRHRVDVDMSKQIFDWRWQDYDYMEAVEKFLPTALPFEDQMHNTFNAWTPGSKVYNVFPSWYEMAGASKLPRVHMDDVVTRSSEPDYIRSNELRVRGGQSIGPLDRGKPENGRAKIPMQYALMQDNETEFGSVAKINAKTYENAQRAFA